MAGEEAFSREETADDHSAFQDHAPPVLRASRLVAAVPVAVEVTERSVIGRECVLVERDERRDCLAGQEPDVVQGIAHRGGETLGCD